MHRGSLEESLESVEEVEPTVDAIISYVKAHGISWLPVDVVVQVQPYAYDHRIGWETYIVTLDGCAVAFTDALVLNVDVCVEEKV